MVRAAAIAAVMIVAGAAGAGAEEKRTITLGPEGGWACAESTDKTRMLVRAASEQKKDLPASCRTLAGGMKLEVEGYYDDGDGVAVADATIDGKDVMVGVFVAKVAAADAPGAAPLKPRVFKRVSPADVRNSPRKWQGREIEFGSAQVYWVEDNDVRIINEGSVVIFARKVGGAEADWFKANCETQEEAFSSKCRATARFTYSGFDEDNPTPVSRRTILASDDVELIRIATQRRRR